MPPFRRSEWRAEDFQLLRDSAIHLFWQPAILAETLSKLRDAGYEVHAVDAKRWTSKAEMHADLARTFSFPAYYGKNLDALNDCLVDVALGAEGSPSPTATVLVIDHFDAFVRADRFEAQGLIDIFADNSRRAMLVGHRMLCLLRSDDPRLRLDQVGATSVRWNSKEWLEKNRGL